MVLQVFTRAGGSATYFPLFTDPNDLHGHRIISVAFVNGDHYIMLNIAENAPMPHPHMFWDHMVDDLDTNQWLRLYRDRLERGIRLNPRNTTRPPEWIDVPDEEDEE